MTLAELIRKAMDARLASVRVAIPARVERYDVETQTADVKPLVKDRLVCEDGILVESMPVIPSVPVAFPRGGGFFISFPLAKGDTGRIVVCDRSIDQWRKKGGEVDPLDVRMHSWAGAVFEPDLADSDHALADAHAENLVIGKDGGAQVHFTPGGEIHFLKESPADAVALASKVDEKFESLKGQLDALKAAIGAAATTEAAAGGTGGMTALNGALSAWPTWTAADVGSAKLKAE